MNPLPGESNVTYAHDSAGIECPITNYRNKVEAYSAEHSLDELTEVAECPITNYRRKVEAYSAEHSLDELTKVAQEASDPEQRDLALEAVFLKDASDEEFKRCLPRLKAAARRAFRQCKVKLRPRASRGRQTGSTRGSRRSASSGASSGGGNSGDGPSEGDGGYGYPSPNNYSRTQLTRAQSVSIAAAISAQGFTTLVGLSTSVLVSAVQPSQAHLDRMVTHLTDDAVAHWDNGRTYRGQGLEAYSVTLTARSQSLRAITEATQKFIHLLSGRWDAAYGLFALDLSDAGDNFHLHGLLLLRPVQAEEKNKRKNIQKAERYWRRRFPSVVKIDSKGRKRRDSVAARPAQLFRQIKHHAAVRAVLKHALSTRAEHQAHKLPPFAQRLFFTSKAEASLLSALRDVGLLSRLKSVPKKRSQRRQQLSPRQCRWCGKQLSKEKALWHRGSCSVSTSRAKKRLSRLAEAKYKPAYASACLARYEQLLLAGWRVHDAYRLASAGIEKGVKPAKWATANRSKSAWRCECGEPLANHQLSAQICSCCRSHMRERKAPRQALEIDLVSPTETS